MNNEINKKLISQKITLIDGIAIFCIVLYHELGGKTTPDADFLRPYLVIFGLCLFTFTAGFKFHFNHSNEILNKHFLVQYSKKRFIRLYKPYIGYTILIFIPFYITIYIAENYLNLHLASFELFFSKLNIYGLINILSGDNFVSGQLWYLVALLGISLFIFLFLYLAKIEGLVILFIVVVISDLLFDSHYYIVNKISMWMPIYIFGILFSYESMYEPSNKKTILLSILFLIIICFSSILFSDVFLHYWPNAKIMFIGLTFPCFIYTSTFLIIRAKKIAKMLSFFGKNSFCIYLFHWPLILPILDRLLMTYFEFNFSILPYLITLMSMILCIYTYDLSKKVKLNKIFE